MMIKEKQMKVCDVCGAMQSMQDNEKRLQTHVEGKLHTGYAKIREYLEMLRRRKLERKLSKVGEICGGNSIRKSCLARLTTYLNDYRI